jgi:NADPH:quinone reductase-like Zn-dependent oxidoreductase
MKALTYQGAKKVKVEKVPDPTIVATDDILLRVTATAICGSDLHIYRGKIPGMKDGDILGHEFMGVVEEAGAAYESAQGRPRSRSLRDRVRPLLLLQQSLFAACENTNRRPAPWTAAALS